MAINKWTKIPPLASEVINGNWKLLSAWQLHLDPLLSLFNYRLLGDLMHFATIYDDEKGKLGKTTFYCLHRGYNYYAVAFKLTRYGERL